MIVMVDKKPTNEGNNPPAPIRHISRIAAARAALSRLRAAEVSDRQENVNPNLVPRQTAFGERPAAKGGSDRS